MPVPLVSVVLPVFNGGADLPKAVDTILAQTFTDFELIIINDGSTDASGAVMDGLIDPRIRAVHQENIGLAGALNRGISLARGVYVARQDHDDWARPTRLEKQLAFMESNAACALVGTCAEIWTDDQFSGRTHDFPADNAALQFELLFHNPFVHSSVMLRKAAVEAVGGYCTDRARQPPEDYELWSRLARKYEVANLSERLTVYREVPTSISRTGENPFLTRVALFCAENLAAAVGETVPTRHHFDIAGLIHRTYDRVSRRPDLREMTAIVERAGKRIADRSPGCDVMERVAVQIENVRHAFHNYQLTKTTAGRLLHKIKHSRPVQGIKRRLLG